MRACCSAYAKVGVWVIGVLGCQGVGVLPSPLRSFSLPDRERQLSAAASLSSTPRPGTRQIKRQQLAPVCPCAGEASGGSRGCAITSGSYWEHPDVPNVMGMDTHRHPSVTGMDTQGYSDTVGIDSEGCPDPAGMDTLRHPDPTGMDTHRHPDPAGMDTHGHSDPIGMDTHRHPDPIGRGTQVPRGWALSDTPVTQGQAPQGAPCHGHPAAKGTPSHISAVALGALRTQGWPRCHGDGHPVTSCPPRGWAPPRPRDGPLGVPQGRTPMTVALLAWPSLRNRRHQRVTSEQRVLSLVPPL